MSIGISTTEAIKADIANWTETIRKTNYQGRFEAHFGLEYDEQKRSWSARGPLDFNHYKRLINFGYSPLNVRKEDSHAQ